MYTKEGAYLNKIQFSSAAAKARFQKAGCRGWGDETWPFWAAHSKISLFFR